MADKNPWEVVDVSPASPKKAEAPKVAETTTENAFPAIEPLPDYIIEQDAKKKTEKKKESTSIQSTAIGAGVGAITGLIQKYMATPDKLQQEIYANAIRNRLQDAGINVMNVKDPKQIVEIARTVLPQRIGGAESQFAELESKIASQGAPLRASGAKVEGASGASNWMRGMAGAEHQIPEKILNTAESMRKTEPKGGQALINKDLEALEKINRMGAGEYKLAGGAESQLMLPPDVAAQYSQDAKRALGLLQSQKAALEMEINRVKSIGGDVSELIAKYNSIGEMERKALQFVSPAQGGQYKPAEKLGYKISRTLPAIGNILSGASAGYNIDEALERGFGGDIPGALAYGAAGAADVASMIPIPAVKGAGTVGALASIPLLYGFEKAREKGYIPPGRPSVTEKKKPRPGERE
jgi:hypothetical protein